MKLTIKSVEKNDFGNFLCVTKNALGESNGSIKLYSKCLLMFINFINFFWGNVGLIGIIDFMLET